MREYEVIKESRKGRMTEVRKEEGKRGVRKKSWEKDEEQWMEG